MAEDSFFWAGTTTGDAGPYSDDEFSDFIRDLLQEDRTTQGVLTGVLNELEVTNPAATTIRVASGKALVDGKLYSNTANVDFSISAPVSGSNYYRIALSKDFSAQTVRATRLGPSTSAPPALTQTDGTKWEISLATVQITSGGIVTITDTRDFNSLPIAIDTEAISDLAITTNKLAADAVTPAKISSAAFPYTTIGDIAYLSAADVLSALPTPVTGQLLRSNGVGVAPSYEAQYIQFGVTVGSGADVPATGVVASFPIVVNCTIISWHIVAPLQAGNIVFDILKGAYADVPLDAGDSITASAKPTLAGAQKAESSTLTGWTTSITAGQYLAFKIDSVSTLKLATIMIKALKV